MVQVEGNDTMKKNDILAIIDYVKVHDVRNGQISVMNTHSGLKFDINGQELIDSTKSADDYDTTENVSKRQAAAVLIHAKDCPFTVCFDKVDGKKRTLRGRLLAPEPLLGRSQVEDLDIDSEHKMRQVDHRTIHWIIINNKKLVVK